MKIKSSNADIRYLSGGPGLFTRLCASFPACLAGLALLLAAPFSARAHQEPPGCTGSGIGILLFTDAGDIHIGDTINYSATVLNGASDGPIVCDASGIQAFVVTPDGVSHTITLVRTELHSGQSDYYPNVASYVVKAEHIQPDGTVRATASDTAVIHQNDTDSQGGANQGVNTEILQPCVKITAVCVPGVGENGVITFTGTVQNCGNDTLISIGVTNTVNGVSSLVTVIPSLAPGQSAPISGSWVPANPCLPSTATLVATGADVASIPLTVTSSVAITCQNSTTPGIKIFKFCPTSPPRPGGLLTFSGLVTNTGNITLTNVVVVNNRPAAGTEVFRLGTLAPGAVATFEGSYLAPTNCTVADTLTVTAASKCGVPVTDSATATCPILTTPAIALTAACPTTPVLPGGKVTYTGTVQNTGDVSLTNVVVLSDLPAANTRIFTIATLAPGASANYSASATLPAGACAITANLSVSANDACTGAIASNTTSINCPIVTAPGLVVTLTCPPAQAVTGGPITLTGTVRNSGNIALNNIIVSSDTPSPTPLVINAPVLAPGASAPFTATFNTPADACSFTVAVTATGTDSCSLQPVTANTSATCPLATTPKIVVTQNCPTSPPDLGGVLTYTGTVHNDGNITLTNVVVTSDRTGGAVVFSIPTLAPGATESFTGSYTVPANSGCTITSTLTASGINKCNGARVSATGPATCPIQGAPSLAVTVACPANPTALGGLLNFTGTVKNTGNITLTNVVVLREGSTTAVFTAPVLAAGKTANFSGSYTVPASDTCSVTTTVTASANDNCGGVTVSAIASVECPLVATPRIVVTQTCPPNPVAPGATMTFSGSVTNTGNVTLTDVTVVSSLPLTNPLIFSSPTLAPGESKTFTIDAIAPLDTCTLSATLTASGNNRCNSAGVTNSVTTTCPVVTTPQISVTKACPATPVLEGGSLVYTGSVANTGDVTLTDVFVYDNQPAPNTKVIGPITLPPGGSTNFTGSYNAPLNVCSITDILTATGRDKCKGTTVTNTATSTCPITTVPKIAVTLVCPPTPSMTGTPITFSGTVRNAGNVTLNNVTVTSAEASPGTVVTLPTLAPGASSNFSYTFTSPADACTVASSVAAVGADACAGQPASANATATCPLLTAPQLVVTQECPSVPASLGGMLFYTGSVKNAGNITLTNVTVVNSRTGNTVIFSKDRLAPGEVALYTGSFAVPPDSGCSIASTATAAGSDPCTGNRITATVSSTCPLSTAPAIVVTQACPTNTVEPGGLLRFTGTVVNTGNVTLTNIVVTSTRPASNTVVFTVATLAPGATANFSGTYQVPLDCCIVSSTVQVTANPLCPGPAVSDSYTATCTVTGTPKIEVTKTCPPAPVKPGDFMDFKGVVKNTGNITLIDVTVVNNLVGPTPVLGPIVLAPGEVVNYSGSYILPKDFCGPDTITAVGLDVCTFAAVTNTAIVPCPIVTTPAIAVTKNCPAQIVNKGGIFTYTGTVRNTGDVTLREVFVMNNKPAPNTAVIGPITLAPGESKDFSGSYTAPACCCETIDTLTATGKDRCTAQVVTASASQVCPLQPSPRLTITRECPATPVAPGGVFNFTGTIRNEGDVVLTNVVVISSQPAGSGPILGPIELGVGETKSFSGSYTVVAGSDPGADTVTVRGQEPCRGQTVTATADCLGMVVPVVRITAVTYAGGNLQVTWTSTVGATYSLQWRDNSRDAAWHDIDGEVTATGVTSSKQHQTAPMDHRVYRVKVVHE